MSTEHKKPAPRPHAPLKRSSDLDRMPQDLYDALVEEESKFEPEWNFSQASGKRLVAPLEIFNSSDPDLWERVYAKTMDSKYAKGTRNYSKKIVGKPVSDSEPPIFLIPRERGGPSYKDVELEGINTDDVQFCAISKGFGMQDVSSFTLGPIVGDGLCLVNAAYSKSICVMHLVGGGRLDLSRKDFWRPGKPTYNIELITRVADNRLLSEVEILDGTVMRVNGEEHEIYKWLQEHENEWLPEWEKWSKSIALCSMGDFHWTDKSPTVAYRYKQGYIDFVEWKKRCYVGPSLQMLQSCPTYAFIKKLFDMKIPLGLVHPKARTGRTEKAITRSWLRHLLDSPCDMTCQPMVICCALLGVEP